MQARGGLSRLGGIAALLAAGVLLAGVVGLAARVAQSSPWLAVLFGIDSGTGGVSMESLQAIRLVDIILLVLTAMTFAGLWPGPSRPRRGWMALAAGLPLAGIAVLAATGLAGRSGLMGGLLVLSVLMLLGPASRSLGFLGLAASLLLLIGDFTTTGPRSLPVAAIVAVGYVLLVAWFLLVGVRLMRMVRPLESMEGVETHGADRG